MSTISASPPVETLISLVDTIVPNLPAADREYSAAVADEEQWRTWREKRDWYERNSSDERRRRIDEHAAEGGFFIRHPVDGELLEALDAGRLRIGEGTLLEPGAG